MTCFGRFFYSYLKRIRLLERVYRTGVGHRQERLPHDFERVSTPETFSILQ